MLDRSTVDGLRAVDPAGAPVLSIYLDVGIEVPEIRSIGARLKGALRPVQAAVDAGLFDPAGTRSIRADLESAGELLAAAPEARGGSLALFICGTVGLAEALALPGPVRDRAVADRSPYLGPIEAMLSHYQRYCAVVADRRTSSIYRFAQGRLEAWEEIGEEEIRKENFGGFEGRDERSVRAHAETVARRLYQATANRIASLLRDGEFDLLMLGGNQANVAGVQSELAPDVLGSLAGTFTIDPGTASAADILERCTEAAARHEAAEAAEAVDRLLEAAAGGNRAVVGFEPVVAAVNQRAVAELIVAPTGSEPGVECTECGWLGRRGGLCGYCGEAARVVPDLVDRIAERTRFDGGQIRYALGETRLGDAQLGAHLRFPLVEGA